MIGYPHIHYAVADSTNLRALELAKAGAPSGTVVTADSQSAGRGRQGRTWVAPPGSCLLFSVIVRKPPKLLSIAGGIAVAETVRSVLSRPARVTLKWPNDVLIDDLKVSGILVQGLPQADVAVLGIGINTNLELSSLPPELQGRAGTLGLTRADQPAVLTELQNQLEHWLTKEPSEVIKAFSKQDALKGQSVRWGTASGIADSITPNGELRVKTDDTVTFLSSGEVHLESTQ